MLCATSRNASISFDYQEEAKGSSLLKGSFANVRIDSPVPICLSPLHPPSSLPPSPFPSFSTGKPTPTTQNVTPLIKGVWVVREQFDGMSYLGPVLSGTESAILIRESNDSESCDSKVALSIDRMRFGWRF